MSSITAGTSAGTALVHTADTTGAFVVKTGVASATGLTVDASQITTLANPLPVASGGTGATTLSGITVGTATTATNLAGGSLGTIPYQSAGGTTAMSAVGASGQFLQSNGAAAPTWGTPVSSAVQTFTASGTWTKPATANFVMVETWGAGGGGGSGLLRSSSGSTGGGGGGGGSYATEMFLASDLPATVSVTVGAGGTGGASRTGASELSGLTGNTGGTSAFASGSVSYLVQGFGGAGGTGGQTGSVNGNGGGGGGVFSSGSTTTGGSPQVLDPVTPFSATITQPFGGGWGLGSGVNGIGSSGFGGGGGSGLGSSSSGGDSFKGGGGGGASGGTTVASSGGVMSRSSNVRASGGTTFSPNGGNGVFGNGGGAGRASSLSSSTPMQSLASIGTIVLGTTSQGGYYRSATGPTSTFTGYQLPSGFTAALPLYGITASSTDFVIAQGTTCYSSTDGISWTLRSTLPFSLDSSGSIKFVNGVYFIFTQSGANLATSTDLITWTDRTSQINASGSTLYDVAWNGTVYVIVASNNRTYTSSNLTSWTLVTLVSAGTIYTVAANGTGRIVAICDTSPFVRYSNNNGATWTNVTATSGGNSPYNRLIFANSAFVFATTAPSAFYSSDGITWNTGTASARSYGGSIIYVSSLFAVGNGPTGSGSLTVSSDGSSWSDQANTPAVSFNGGAGGAGGIAGGGGGGATADVNRVTGAGGNGGAGLVRVYTW